MYIEISIIPTWLVGATFSLYNFESGILFFSMVVCHDLISLLNFYEINHVFHIHCCFR